MRTWLNTMLVLAVGIGLGRGAYSPGRHADTVTVAGPSANRPDGEAWGVTMCPASGGIATAAAFIVQGPSAGAGNATMLIENHTAATTMCTLVIPCTAPDLSTVSVECATGVTCAPGDAVHIEWKDNGCEAGAAPTGAGSGSIRAL